MKVAIHQPNYFPWLGYFYKIYQSDCFVLLDDVQFSNQGMHHYHYIKTPTGIHRLKIPVEQHMGDLILDVKTKDTLGWKQQHLKTMEMNYKKAAHFSDVFPDYQRLIENDYPDLCALNQSVITFILSGFGIDVQLVRSSSLKTVTTREQKVIDICLTLGADTYISGTGARAYQQESDFVSNQLQLVYAEYTPFEYEQLWGDFQANVSVIDYLMNCGYDWGRIIENQKKHAAWK